MKMFVCAIRDRATDTYGTPVFVVSVAQAVRSFSDEINAAREGNALAAHPEDYDLYSLGIFDTETGRFEQGDVRQVSIGKDLVK